MSSRIDSLKTVSNAKPIQLESNPINNSNIAIFSNKTLKPSIDEVSFSNRNIDVNIEEKADTKKKWLIGAGIAVGTIAVGAASYFLLKKLVEKILEK